MSYHVAYVKIDGHTIFSTCRFATIEEAKQFQFYIFGENDETKVVETDEPVNAEYSNGVLKFKWGMI